MRRWRSGHRRDEGTIVEMEKLSQSITYQMITQVQQSDERTQRSVQEVHQELFSGLSEINTKLRKHKTL